MTYDQDLAVYLNGLQPDPAAKDDARIFSICCPDARQVRSRLEDLLMTFVSFFQQENGPRLPGAHSHALAVFAYAASGLYTLLSDGEKEGRSIFDVLTCARAWAQEHVRKARESLPQEARAALLAAPFPAYWLWPAWMHKAQQAGHEVQAARFLAWSAVVYLFDQAPKLEDGQGEEMTSAVLQAAKHPTPKPAPDDLPLLMPSSSPDALAWPDPVPGLADFVHVAQYVEALESGRVRVSMGGGEDYEVTRQDVTLTPLPDGSAFIILYPGTLDASTIRLSPEDAATARQALNLNGEEEDGTMSP